MGLLTLLRKLKRSDNEVRISTHAAHRDRERGA